MSEYNNEIEEEEKEKQPTEYPIGTGTICFICNKEISIEDIEGKIGEDGKVIKKPGNGPMRMNNIPGFLHRFCKAKTDMDIVNSGQITGNYTKEQILDGKVR